VTRSLDPPAPWVRRVRTGTYLVLAAAIGVFGWQLWRSTRPPAPVPGLTSAAVATPDFDIVVPPGYLEDTPLFGRRPLLPRRLVAHVGQTIRIRNHDRSVVNAGIFVVQPGQTLVQRFTRPGTYSGTCLLHPAGRFTLVVTR